MEIWVEIEMKEKSRNPAIEPHPKENSGAGLIRGIEMSGYPLQGVTARHLLNRNFDVVEEWGYADRETQESRTLDLVAHLALAEQTVPVYSHASLLIECKKSAHPYVFFRSPTLPEIPWSSACYGPPSRRDFSSRKGQKRLRYAS
jgi:hypothetical protein